MGDTDDWTFFGVRGDLITIYMKRSDGLDPFVGLRAPSGLLEAFDNDGGKGKNALISGWELQEAGTYTIRSRAFLDASIGRYRLSLDVSKP